MTAAQERNQRIRIGVTGLAFIFLLVVIGSAMTQEGREAADNAVETIAEEDAPPVDPLEEIGAAPRQAPAPTEPVETPADEADSALTDALRDDLAEGGAREGIVEE